MHNICIGREAGAIMLDARYNVLIGDGAGRSLVGGEYNLIIGNDIDVPSSDCSNYVNIGNLLVGYHRHPMLMRMLCEIIYEFTREFRNELDVDGGVGVRQHRAGDLGRKRV